MRRVVRTGQGRSAASGPSAPRRLRCAIYTRKSSEEGLELDFNSLHAQREACEAYVTSQRHEGWTAISARYDDGGYSGGSMVRPGLVRLLADIQSGLIDVVVVYKVDRLTRSLTDFARIVETFDANNASFVSVTQAFNTTSSMGRLTLNVLLSFAQFEREVTTERIRDKIAASKRKGIWMGGVVPLGYRVARRKLLIDEAEAITVRMIFALYQEKRSIAATAAELRQRGILSRLRPRSNGTISGGISFDRGALQSILRNRIYIGEIIHKGIHHPGEHQAILDQAIFEAVQDILNAQFSGEGRSPHRMGSLLTGRIFDSAGNRMTPSHASKKGVRYRYYISRALIEGQPERSGTPARISAPAIEQLVIDALRGHPAAQDYLRGATATAPGDVTAAAGDATGAAHTIAQKAAVTASPGNGQNHSLSDSDLIANMLERVDVDETSITLTLAAPDPDEDDDLTQELQPAQPAERITIRCTLGHAKPIQPRVIPSEGEGAPTAPRLTGSQMGNTSRLISTIVRSQSWLAELRSGRVDSIQALARRDGRSERNIRMMLNLAFLSPDIIAAILDGGLPPTVNATDLAQGLPLDWVEQRRWIMGGEGLAS
jgi:site-specific DNA recombinase